MELAIYLFDDFRSDRAYYLFIHILPFQGLDFCSLHRYVLCICFALGKYKYWQIKRTAEGGRGGGSVLGAGHLSHYSQVKTP